MSYLKATEFDLATQIRFSVDEGLTTFQDTRLVIFDANAIGLLRQGLLEALGQEEALGFLFRFGYQNGFSDFLQMKLSYSFDTEMDLLASGPVIHTWEGIVKAAPSEIRYDRSTGDFYFTGVWTNSYEAEQHLTFNPVATAPVCWTLTGYATGWCTAFFGSPLLAMEPTCVGKGDESCGWLIQPPGAFGDAAKPFVEAVEPLWRNL